MRQGFVEIVAQRCVAVAEIAAADSEVAACQLFQCFADRRNDTRLQFRLVSLHVEIVLSFGIQLSLLFFLTALHGMALAHLVLKRGRGLRHHAHFIGEVRVGNFKRDILVCHFAEGTMNIAKRLRNATDDIEGGGKRQHEDQRADGERFHHVASNLRVQIVNIDAGHDHNLPWLESKGVGAFGVVVAFHTGLRAVEIRLPTAIAAEPHQFVTIGKPLAVRLALEIFTDPFRIRMELHRHVVVITEEVTVRCEPHGADGGISLFHGLLVRKRSGFFLIVKRLQDGDCRLHLCAQHAVAFLIDRVGCGSQLVKGRHGKGGHQGHHENDQLTRNGKVLHGCSQAFGIARRSARCRCFRKGEAPDARKKGLRRRVIATSTHHVLHRTIDLFSS